MKREKKRCSVAEQHKVERLLTALVGNRSTKCYCACCEGRCDHPAIQPTPTEPTR